MQSVSLFRSVGGPAWKRFGNPERRPLPHYSWWLSEVSEFLEVDYARNDIAVGPIGNRRRSTTGTSPGPVIRNFLDVQSPRGLCRLVEREQEVAELGEALPAELL
jgi:hypothetical protein